MTYQIVGHCSTCHYCYNECPVHAIGFVGVEYAIDPEKCTGCGICEEICPAGVIVNTEAELPASHEPVTTSADAVVVGAGGAGLVAAVRLAELTGRRIVVLEKAVKAGGNTTLGHNFILRNSKVHRAAGLPDLREEHAKRLADNSPGLSRPLIRRATFAVSGMFDWLYDTSDLKDYIELVYFKNLDPGMADFMSWGAEAFVDFPRRSFENLKSTDHSMGPGWMGTFVIKNMLRRCDELGIEILTGCAAQEILLNEAGNFRGIRAQGKGGDVTVYADSCLLASGGFSNARDIMDRVLPEFNQGFPTHTFTMAAMTGDAIRMVENIGGDIDLSPEHTKIPLFGPTHHPYPFSSVVLSRCPEMVYINKTGKRFMNEGKPGGPGERRSPLEDQPDKIAWALVDELTLERLGKRIIADAARDPGYQKCMEPWRKQLEEECSRDLAAQKAGSIEALAELIDVAPKVLADTVNQYNAFCESGIDESFGKAESFLSKVAEPPFYALFLCRFNEGAEGGIVNDDCLRVLRLDGSPISGLYAAGDCCRGLIKADDNGGKFGEMGWAMASGFIAAEEMANYQNHSAE
jgi:succinate dehydrogenase/fumarate reductase flavoprotein subunit/NAD-dependent dihydropyrimidine dehydrogenase PreA subunit